VRSEPINWIDPTGFEIKYKGSLLQKLRIWWNIQQLRWNSATAGKIIDRLERSQEVVTNEITAGANSYAVSTNACYYNPNKENIYSGSEPWHKRPDEVGLAHELIHALHDVEGWLGWTRQLEEEWTVGIGRHSNLPYTENRIRAQYGLPLRPRY
jgi:hypothetical protein